MHRHLQIRGLTTRRVILRQFVTVATALSAPRVARWASGAEPGDDWAAMREDPVRKRLRGQPELDTILTLYPRTQGPPAFDPGRIAEGVRSLRTHPAVDTGHPFLDRSVKVGLAHIDATFRGDHPKYGVGTYAGEEHDGFPPTIIAAVDALTAWGLNERARRLYRYWLATFVKDDGRIRYYGPSIAEYGQLLHTAALLEERAGPADWWADGFMALDRIAEYLLRLRAAAGADGLIFGVPEADMRADTGRYFHNEALARART